MLNLLVCFGFVFYMSDIKVVNTVYTIDNINRVNLFWL